MPLEFHEKMRWLEQVSKALAARINKEYKTNDVEQAIDLLIEELLEGFHWIIKELKKLDLSAAAEFYNWSLQNRDAWEAFFQLDPKAIEHEPWSLTLQVQQMIPQKYILYFFYVAKNLYDSEEILRADRIFRLLTLLYPHHANFWIWLGLCQQKRELPELALISNTIATVLDKRSPVPHYYMAQSWVQLKEWNRAIECFKACFEKIDSDPSFQHLRKQCQELHGILLKNPQVLENYSPQILVEEKTTQPNESNQSSKSEEPLLKPLILDQWKAAFDELKKKIADLEGQLIGKTASFKHEVNTLDFFEQHTFAFAQNRIRIPISSFLEVYPFELGIFFGEFIAGVSLSFERKAINEQIESNLFSRIASTFSTLLDSSKPKQKTISKYAYLYSQQMDITFNFETLNPEYGSSKKSYEYVREDNRIRVSHFLREDIVDKSILDCGCNEGGVLFACRNLGAKGITGFDINSWCINRANELVSTQKIADARFYVGDMENRAFLTTLPVSDTVLLLAILDTSYFANKTAVISNLSRFAKHTLYYEGHVKQDSHVPRMYELLIATDFTRFEYLGRFSQRILIRCTRDLMMKEQIPANASTSDDPDEALLSASEIYLFTDSSKNPPFSNKCKLIQFVKR